MRQLMLAFALSGAAVLGSGCAHAVIPNTEVEDTSPNRDVVQFVERYRQAVEQRDVAALMALVSERYLDDNGTPSGTDDVDHEGMHDKLSRWRDGLLDVRYEIRYRRVTFERGHVLVDFTYTGNFRIATPDGDRWARRLADNRLVLAREGDEYRILSGM